MANMFTDCFLAQYADDTQFVLTGKIQDLKLLQRKAEEIMQRAKLYFQQNGLNVNEKKTQCMFIGSRQLIAQIPEGTTFTFNGELIKPSNSVKNLGLYMDSYMSLETHINMMSKKVFGTLSFINRKAATVFNKQTRITIIKTLV